MEILQEELLFLGEKRLPTGTILFEKYGLNGGGQQKFSLVLPTSQEIEIVCVGGGGPVLGTVVDL